MRNGQLSYLSSMSHTKFIIVIISQLISTQTQEETVQKKRHPYHTNSPPHNKKSHIVQFHVDICIQPNSKTRTQEAASFDKKQTRTRYCILCSIAVPSPLYRIIYFKSVDQPNSPTNDEECIRYRLLPRSVLDLTSRLFLKKQNMRPITSRYSFTNALQANAQ